MGCALKEDGLDMKGIINEEYSSYMKRSEFI